MTARPARPGAPRGESAAGPESALPRPRAVLIGLVGPSGCGKTTVARRLAARGAAVIDADELTREVMASGSDVAEAVIAHFGETFRRPDGSLDRTGLGRLVFADAARLVELEAIVHPGVRRRIVAAVREADAARPDAIVLEAIKLVEAGYATSCDEVWLVTCTEDTQLARLAGRGVDEVDARQRQRAQRGLAPTWRRAATRVLRTDGSLAAVEAAVDAALAEALGRRLV